MISQKMHNSLNDRNEILNYLLRIIKIEKKVLNDLLGVITMGKEALNNLLGVYLLLQV